jgi:uncharacterized protein (DUF58 family)
MSFHHTSSADRENKNVALTSQALQQLNRLQLNTSRFLPGAGSGARPSHRRRPAMDFREHRMYAPGDDVRFVDWRASARQEHIFIKQGEQLKNASIYLLVDCSASMTWGTPPKSQSTLELAAALGFMTLAQGDRLIVVPLIDPEKGKGPPPLGPVSGKGQFPGLLNYLRALRFAGQVDFGRALAGFRRRNSRGGLVLLLSDLLGAPDLAPGLEALTNGAGAPAWNVVLFHLLHPEELNPALHGDFKLQDIETGQVKRYVVTEKALEIYVERLQAWRDSLERTCQDRNAFYTLIPTHWSLERETLPHLRGANVVKSL